MIEAQPQPKKTYDDLRRECAARGFYIGPNAKKPIDVDAVCKEFGIPRELWDAIPDAKEGA